jgi:radical SAM protein with 4Fe4S-binding SPASM domain
MGEIKPSFDTDRQTLGKIYPLDTPFNVILDASEVCNFRCEYCFRASDDKNNWGYARNSQLMDWGIFEKAVEQIKEFPKDVKQISLSNHGEPLCNRKVPYMVKYIKNQGIKSRISIHTNATMLDEKYAIELADSGIDRVVVSLQGLSTVKYKEVCKADIDFDIFYHNLSVLYEHKKNTQIYFKIMDVALDEDDEQKFYEMFSPIADRVYVEKMVPIWKDVDLSSVSKNKYVGDIQNKYGERFPKQDCCPLIFNTIVVNPMGDVYPCTQLLTPYKLGNIENNTLLELWNSDMRGKLLIKQCKKENPDICRDCFILQNSIYSKEDMIDEYRFEILRKLESKIVIKED